MLSAATESVSARGAAKAPGGMMIVTPPDESVPPSGPIVEVMVGDAVAGSVLLPQELSATTKHAAIKDEVR